MAKNVQKRQLSPRNLSVAQVERLLDEHAALRDLEELVGQGCDRRYLLDCLVRLSSTDPRLNEVSSWIGQSPHQAKQTVRKIRNCAVLIHEINATPYGGFLAHTSDGQKELSLPQNLRFYANALAGC